jgi:hypothetical protein
VIEAAKKRAGWSGECISTGQRLLRTTLLALYFLCILGSLCISLKGWVNVYDEGLAVLNGVRVLRGEIPYRDFWTVYPPGQSYALAAVYNLLGVSLLAARAYDTLVRFALVIGVYLVGRRIATPAAALVAGAFSALWLGTVGFYSYGVFPALAFALLATWSLIAFAGSEQAGWLVLAGALTGLTALWRVDIALYLGIALTLSLLLLATLSLGSRGPARRLARTLHRVGILIAMAAVLSVPAYAYLALVGGPEPIWQQLVVFPSVVLGSVRRLPYPQVVPDVALFLAEPREYVRWARYAGLSWLVARADSADRPGCPHPDGRGHGGDPLWPPGLCAGPQPLRLDPRVAVYDMGFAGRRALGQPGPCRVLEALAGRRVTLGSAGRYLVYLRCSVCARPGDDPGVCFP